MERKCPECGHWFAPFLRELRVDGNYVRHLYVCDNFHCDFTEKAMRRLVAEYRSKHKKDSVIPKLWVA